MNFKNKPCFFAKHQVNGGHALRINRNAEPAVVRKCHLQQRDYQAAIALLEEGYRTRAGWLWLVPQPVYPWELRMGALPEFRDLVARIKGDFDWGW